MLELLFLLLPVAAGYGWFMGRNSILHEQRRKRKHFQQQYSKGLNYLLNNQHEKALDELISTLTISSETAETHFALAQLFRKRGQLDKALKIHEYLVEQAELNEEDAGRAIFELAEDFVSAGMYDKAEQEYAKLINQPKYQHQTAQALLRLFRITKDWEKGMRIGDLLPESESECRQVVANFYCEYAAHKPLDEKIEILEAALRYWPTSERAALELGRAYIEAERHAEAINLFQSVLTRAPEFLGLILADLKKVNECGELCDDVKVSIGQVEQHQHYATSVIATADQLLQEKGVQSALKYMLASLRKRPNIKVFSHLLSLHQTHDQILSAADMQNTVSEMVNDFISSTREYVCQHCGLTTTQHHWQCARCHHWETIKPQQGLTGE